jgi:hypothetical protein
LRGQIGRAKRTPSLDRSRTVECLHRFQHDQSVHALESEGDPKARGSRAGGHRRNDRVGCRPSRVARFSVAATRGLPMPVAHAATSCQLCSKHSSAARRRR